MDLVQVNLCQKLLFLHQLTHNMTTDCALFMKIVSSEYLQNMLCTQIVVCVLFWHSEQIGTQHVLQMLRASEKDLPVHWTGVDHNFGGNFHDDVVTKYILSHLGPPSIFISLTLGPIPKSLIKYIVLVFPVLESRPTVLRKGCACVRPKAENLWPFQDTFPAWKNMENKWQTMGKNVSQSKSRQL